MRSAPRAAAVAITCAMVLVPMSRAGSVPIAQKRMAIQNLSTGQPPRLAPACQFDASSPEADLVERAPQVAVNPLDQNNIVAIWEQSNRNQAWDPTGELGNETVITAATSFDGGDTWTQAVVPNLNCRSGSAGGPYDGPVAEPDLVFGPDGTLYLTATWNLRVPSNSDPTVVTSVAAVEVSTSADGGRTWTGPTQIDAGDRGVIAPDPTHPGDAYILYHQPVGEPGNTVLARRLARAADGSLAVGPPSVALPAGPLGVQALAQEIGVLADGTLVAVVLEGTPFVTGRVLSVVSRDRGVTWSLPSEVGACDPDFPKDHDAMRYAVAGWNSPSLAVRGQRAYVVWTDLAPDLMNGTDPLPDYGHVVVASTVDGATWTAHSIVNPLESRGHQVMEARVAVNGDGDVGVLYYDFRNDVPADNTFTSDVWFARSRDRGATWQETHVDGPFDLRAVGPAAISNYIDLTAGRTGFDAVYALGAPLRPRLIEGEVDVFRGRVPT